MRFDRSFLILGLILLVSGQDPDSSNETENGILDGETVEDVTVTEELDEEAVPVPDIDEVEDVGEVGEEEVEEDVADEIPEDEPVDGETPVDDGETPVDDEETPIDGEEEEENPEEEVQEEPVDNRTDSSAACAQCIDDQFVFCPSANSRIGSCCYNIDECDTTLACSDSYIDFATKYAVCPYEPACQAKVFIVGNNVQTFTINGGEIPNGALCNYEIKFPDGVTPLAFMSVSTSQSDAVTVY